MGNRPSVDPADRNRGNPSLTMRFYGFNYRLALGPCQTKDFKKGSGPCLDGTQHEEGTTTPNWSAW